MKNISRFFKSGNDNPSDGLERRTTTDREKGRDELIDTPVPFLSWRSFVMGVFVSMGGFVFGYDTGQIAGLLEMKDFLRRFGEPKPSGDGFFFSNIRAGLIVGLLSIGTLIGSLLAAPLGDRIGRKWSISGWCVVLSVGILVQITSDTPRWYQIVIGRWIAGLGVGALSLLVPLYQGESAPRHIRGAMISCYQLFITLGIFVANCINYGTESRNDSSAWRIPVGITFAWILILGVGISLFPESPRYDYRTGHIERAKTSMMRFYGIPHNHRQLHVELEEIRLKYEEEKSAKEQPWYEIFIAPRMAYRLVLGVSLQALQQLTGANYFFYYGTTVFKGAGIENSYITQIILGAVNFGSTFLGLYNIEHFGRRKPLIFGALWMFVCFLVFASVGHFRLNLEDPTLTPGPGKVMVAFACLFILGFASTWGPIVWAIVSELYPSRYRARAMSFATASNWLWNFLIAFFTPLITGDIGFRYGYVFAGCLFLAASTVYLCVIEGKGRTLEELDAMYVMRVPAWKSENYVLPPLEGQQDRHSKESFSHNNDVAKTDGDDGDRNN
ncbi:high-affinity hexose transporter HXT6 [Paracoccidioides lutzii Pb01]|uniref:High-affinity hexose transporter HXT6 n=1 Tax=Paracoccidioides lutzii (strain ATCC MYA-826 / Pb01) TaxID=502779 RepID=C1GXW6_PARBA|nr:high-affinity hexose transporter HXT6 [Paracoccidioides lutzii Pb01]EEH41686.2 high-affinity hexose transporter HXT6 [Paracoccidioides lutzii Pb01]